MAEQWRALPTWLRGLGIGFVVGLTIGFAIAVYYSIRYSGQPINNIPPRIETLELGVMIAAALGFPGSMLFSPLFALSFPFGWLVFMVFAPSANCAVIGAGLGALHTLRRRRAVRHLTAGAKHS